MSSTALAKVMPQAMAFFHADGLPSAWNQAMKFAGPGGRVATIPDIIAARLASEPGSEAWETYYTTASAEYFGRSKSGKLILIVAHGIGPMSTLEGIKKAYAWHYKDKTRQHHGGRITEEEFWDLEAGKYGEVSIIDFESYCARGKYPFYEVMRVTRALGNPLLRARLGPEAEDYIVKHGLVARKWHAEQAGHSWKHRDEGAHDSNPFILRAEDPANCCYTFGVEHGHRQIEEGYAIAHLLVIEQLVHLIHDSYSVLTSDIGCHEWYGAVRFVGIRAGGNMQGGLHQGPNVWRLLRKHWRELFEPAEPLQDIGFRALKQIGDEWFTQYPKIGERMDTGEPEYHVTSIEKVGEPVLFRTTSSAAYVFFKYGINEVRALAPQGANAYCLAGTPELDKGDPEHTSCPVQFYRIEADTSKRLRRPEDLARDYETLMQLIEKDIA